MLLFVYCSSIEPSWLPNRFFFLTFFFFGLVSLCVPVWLLCFQGAFFCSGPHMRIWQSFRAQLTPGQLWGLASPDCCCAPFFLVLGICFLGLVSLFPLPSVVFAFFSELPCGNGLFLFSVLFFFG